MGQYGHVFRPGPFHRRRAYWLDSAVLHWRIDSAKGHVQLADIASMRLNLAEGTGSAARCVLVEKSGRVHRLCDRYWPIWAKEERLYLGRLQQRNATLRNLTSTLGRRLRKANPDAVLETGPSRGEWTATCLVALFGVTVIVAGAVLMAVQGQISCPAVAFMALVAVFLPMLWPVIRSGGPKPLDHDALRDAKPQPDRVTG